MIWARKFEYLGWAKVRYLLACYLPYLLSCSSAVTVETQISGNTNPKITPTVPQHCKQLKQIDLSVNDLSGDGGPALGTLLRALPTDQLEMLQLSRCKLGDRNAKLILEGLLGSLALKQLDLSWNGLGMGSVEGQRGKGAASAISNLLEARTCPLESICLSYNQLLSKHAGRIAAAFRHNSKLRKLDLSWNGIGNDGVMHLADALRGNQALTELDLTHVEMKERGAMVIADVLKGTVRKKKTHIYHLFALPVIYKHAIMLQRQARDKHTRESSTQTKRVTCCVFFL